MFFEKYPLLEHAESSENQKIEQGYPLAFRLQIEIVFFCTYRFLHALGIVTPRKRWRKVGFTVLCCALLRIFDFYAKKSRKNLQNRPKIGIFRSFLAIFVKTSTFSSQDVYQARVAPTTCLRKPHFG